MRLKANEQQARLVRSVLLNGKDVPMCHEADEEEGWVTSYMPILPEDIAENGEELVECDDETKSAGFTLVKRTGKVQILFRKQ